MSMISTRGKANSKQGGPAFTEPTVALKPRELHPMAQEAAVRWSEMCEEVDHLRADLQRARNDLEVAQRVDLEKDRMLADMRDRLSSAEKDYRERITEFERICLNRVAELENTMERYRRYAVQMSEDVGIVADVLLKAHEKSLDIAKDGPSEQHLQTIETGLKELVETLPRKVAQ